MGLCALALFAWSLSAWVDVSFQSLHWHVAAERNGAQFGYEYWRGDPVAVQAMNERYPAWALGTRAWLHAPRVEWATWPDCFFYNGPGGTPKNRRLFVVLSRRGWLKVPFWTLSLALLIPTLLLWWRDRPFPPGHCRNCGYNLTGNVSGRCPECGAPVPPEQATATRAAPKRNFWRRFAAAWGVITLLTCPLAAFLGFMDTSYRKGIFDYGAAFLTGTVSIGPFTAMLAAIVAALLARRAASRKEYGKRREFCQIPPG